MSDAHGVFEYTTTRLCPGNDSMCGAALEGALVAKRLDKYSILVAPKEISRPPQVPYSLGWPLLVEVMPFCL